MLPIQPAVGYTSAVTKWIEMLPWYPRYYVSHAGQIFGRRGELLAVYLDKDGHPETHIRDLSKRDHHARISRIVCWHFNGPFPDDGNLYDAFHLDGNKQNNNYHNLRWKFSRINYTGNGNSRKGRAHAKGKTMREYKLPDPSYDFDPFARHFPGPVDWLGPKDY
jgi:hypothetical protein